MHGTEDVSVHLLAAADVEHHGLMDALDEIALGNLREALDDDDDLTPQQAQQEAMHAVNASLELLSAAGLQAKGSITGADPVPATVEAARADDSDEVIVVTPPHIIKAGLHRDWASRLRDELPLPVLHVVSGTDRIVS